MQVSEVYLVHVDTWFDFKWLLWWSWPRGENRPLVVPPFNPNRVRGQKHLVRDAASLMVYRSGTDGYAWYASFKNDGRWRLKREARVSRRELQSFEDRGRQLELVGEPRA